MAKPTIIFDQDKLLQDFPRKFRQAVARTDANELRPIYTSIAKKLEPVVEAFFYSGAQSSGSGTTAKWGKGTVRSLRETVDVFANKSNPNKAYAVLGPHKMYSGAMRGTPAHDLFLKGERAARGTGRERQRLTRRFKQGRGGVGGMVATALRLRGSTVKYPYRPAYDRANGAAAALYVQAFRQTDNKVIQALRTEFKVQ